MIGRFKWQIFNLSYKLRGAENIPVIPLVSPYLFKVLGRHLAMETESREDVYLKGVGLRIDPSQCVAIKNWSIRYKPSE